MPTRTRQVPPWSEIEIFIWKFYGLEALGTAEHHVIHLKEYCETHNFEKFESNIEDLEEGGTQAFLILDEKNAITAHGFLKPDAAFVVS